MRHHLRGLLLWTMIGALSTAIIIYLFQFARFLYRLLLVFPDMSANQKLVFALIVLCTVTIVCAIALFLIGDEHD